MSGSKIFNANVCWNISHDLLFCGSMHIFTFSEYCGTVGELNTGNDFGRNLQVYFPLVAKLCYTTAAGIHCHCPITVTLFTVV